MARALQSSDTIARFLALGGSIARQRGDYAQAQRQLVEALALYRELGAKDELWRTLEELAFRGARRRAVRAERAAAGRGRNLLRSRRHRALAVEQTAYDHCATIASAALGTEAFEAAWAGGRALPLEDALALATEVR